MKKTSNKGQVLIITLAVAFAFFLLSLLVIETGNYFYHKIKLQNSADALAMDSGIWYARSLNLTSATNKFRWITYELTHNVLIEAAIEASCGCLPAIKKADKALFEVQSMEKLVVPMSLVYLNALKDFALEDKGTVCIPCFWPGVVPKLGFFTDKERKKVKISYTYEMPDGTKKKAGEGDVEFHAKASKYRLKKSPGYYVDRVVEIKGDDSQRNDIKKMEDNMGNMIGEAMKEEAKKKIAALKKNFMYIEETGQQEIIVFCRKKVEPIIMTKWMPKDFGAIYSASKVRIEGGRMTVSDFYGAQYYPKIENIGVYEAAEKVNKVLDFLSGPPLHIKSKFLTKWAGAMEKVYH